MEVSTREMTAAALLWLRTEKHCVLLSVERGFAWGEPDALGVMPDRRLVEIEVKQSMSDFYRNSEKIYIKVLNGECINRIEGLPSIYYYLVPPRMAEKVKGVLPKYAGLMTMQECETGIVSNSIKVVVPAPRMERRRLNSKQMIHMAKNQTLSFLGEYIAFSDCIRRHEIERRYNQEQIAKLNAQLTISDLTSLTQC